MAKIPINISSGTVKENVEKGIIVGIDLGTTNSLVAFMKDGVPDAVADKSGKNTLVPSIVYFDPLGEVLVGNEAKKFLTIDPANTIYSVKRLMGKSYADMESYGHHLGYRIIDEDQEGLVKIGVRDKYYTPVELSAKILIQLKKRVEELLQTKVSRAVITVPAYFNDAQRQATRDAGKLAGLEVLRIVNEPTAASLAYGIGLDKEKGLKVAVYDLGGGTFDISILEIRNGIFEVLSTHGDTFLGGDDFDQAIINFWIETGKIRKKDLTENPVLGQSLRLKAEKAKMALSSAESFKTQFENSELELTRAQFNKLINPFVSRTLDSCKQAIKDSGLSFEQIDHVIMVGGSTRVPFVKDSVSKLFGKTVYDKLNPDEVVALGAAIQADILAGNNKDFLLLDITPLSLGIETMGGLMDVIIPRNSKVPTKVARQYTTSVDGQSRLKVAVYQGERDLVEDNRSLGEFILEGIPPMPAGLAQIEISFFLDADGILRVKAKELRSGVEQTITVKSPYGISEEEMARMLVDSIKHAEEDMNRRGILEARNEAVSLLKSTEKFLNQNADIFSLEEQSGIRKMAKKLENILESGDKDKIHKAIEALNDHSRPLAQIALERTINQAVKGKKILE